MKKSFAVTVLADDATLPIDENIDKKYHEDQSTEFHIVKALKELGHEVSIVGVWDEVEPVVQKIKELKPDVVFNLTEQFRNNRMLDRDIAGLLELLNVPFTGAGPAGLMLSRNKAICKQILSTRKIRVPGFFTILPGKKVRAPRNIHFPLVVKPLYEDASEGISNASLVKNIEELTARSQWVHETFKQPVIAEEFIEGRELYVSIVGNKRLKVLPFRELHFDNTDNNGPVMATSRVKWNEKYQKKWNIKFGFGENIDEKVAARIARVCKKVFRLLHIHDYGRVDLRLTPDNRIFILEANCNPDLHYFEEVAESARKIDISFPQLINRILYSALKRYRIEH